MRTITLEEAKAEPECNWGSKESFYRACANSLDRLAKMRKAKDEDGQADLNRLNAKNLRLIAKGLKENA